MVQVYDNMGQGIHVCTWKCLVLISWVHLGMGLSPCTCLDTSDTFLSYLNDVLSQQQIDEQRWSLFIYLFLVLSVYKETFVHQDLYGILVSVLKAFCDVLWESPFWKIVKHIQQVSFPKNMTYIILCYVVTWCMTVLAGKILANNIQCDCTGVHIEWYSHTNVP